MITYKVLYDEHKGPFKITGDRSYFNTDTLNTITNKSCSDALNRVLNHVVSAFNSFLKKTQDTPDIFYCEYHDKDKWIETHNQLLDLIIPDLRYLNAQIYLTGSMPVKKISEDILSILKKCKQNVDVNLFHIMKVLTHFQMPGIKKIEFINKEGNFDSFARLLDVNYPLDLVSNDYNCSISKIIMSDPCKVTMTEFVDRTMVKSTQPTHVPTDNEKLDKINLFIKKVEYLYFAYNADQHYKNLYRDQYVQELLQDMNIPYEEWCARVNQHASISNTTHFVFFKTIKETSILPKVILDLFAKYQIYILKPEKTDLEQLVRRMAAAGDNYGLSELLNSPLLDVVKLNVHAKNSKHQTAIDLIHIYKEQYPKLNERYVECQKLLENFQPLRPIIKVETCSHSVNSGAEPKMKNYRNARENVHRPITSPIMDTVLPTENFSVSTSAPSSRMFSMDNRHPEQTQSNELDLAESEKNEADKISTCSIS